MISNLGDREKFHRVFILVLAIAVSLVFFFMIRGFLVTVLMAAIFSGLSFPLYRRLLGWVKGRRALAAILTLLTLLILVVLPLAGFMGIVATEAVSISQSVSPWVREHLREPGQISRLLERIPFLAQLQEQVQVYSAQIIEKLGELAGMVSSLLVNSLSAATKGTVGFLFQLFVMVYAMFFFLVGGRGSLDKALVYIPLPEADKELLVDKFVSVARATIKGTFVVGLVQGGLAGLAFAVVGIHGSAFWGTIMVVLSIIPGIGTALIWGPAIWCAVVVGTVDNFLRPKLVGADTKMPDLLILLSTFGGLSMFGAVGLVLGPIIAAVFIAVWKIYGEAFGDLLKADSSPGDSPAP